jgi:hypothetical protein
MPSKMLILRNTTSKKKKLLIYLHFFRTIRIAQPADERSKLDGRWKNLSVTARSKNSKFVDPVVPFKEDVCLCDFNNVYRNIYDKEKFLNEKN